MKRGDPFKVRKPDGDPKLSRVFVVVSRPALIASRFSTLICAPVSTSRHGLATEVSVGLDEGLEHESAVPCDALVSLRKAMLADSLGSPRPFSSAGSMKRIASRSTSSESLLNARRAARPAARGPLA